MKTQIRKRIQIQPIKSPSPDLAHRNYMRSTIAPLQQIEKYNQRSRSSSPRFINSSMLCSSTNQFDKIKNELTMLREENSRLKNHQIENSRLVERNSMLIQQISNLRNETDKKKNGLQSSNNSSDKPNYNEKENILKEFTERLNKLSQQNKKISKKIQDQNVKIQFLNKQNQMLKNQIVFYKRQQQRLSNNNSNNNIQKLQIDSIFKSFEKDQQNKFNIFEEHFIHQFNDLQLKIDKIRVLQNIIQQRLQNKKIKSARTCFLNSNSPMPDYSMIGTTWKSKIQNQTLPLQGQSQQSDSLINNTSLKEMQDKHKFSNIKLNQQIQTLNKEIDELKQSNNIREKQISILQQTNKELNLKINKLTNDKFKIPTPTLSSQLNTVKQSQLVFLKEKISYLQNDIKCKLNSINNLQQQCTLKEKECNLTKKRLQETNYFLEHEMSNFQKVIDQQKARSIIFQNQINDLNEQLENEHKKNYQLKQLKQQLSKVPKLMADIQLLQSQITEKDKLLCNALKQYLQFVKCIKSTISSEKIMISITKYEDSFTNLEKIKKQNANVIGQLKRKLITKEQKMIQLQKYNKLLKVENQQLIIQSKKLQQLIKAYSIPSIKEEKDQQDKKTINYENKENINFNLKECLKSTISEVQKLEQKINSHLTQLTQIYQE